MVPSQLGGSSLGTLLEFAKISQNSDSFLIVLPMCQVKNAVSELSIAEKFQRATQGERKKRSHDGEFKSEIWSLFFLRLDAFHAMQRISSTLKKTHPLFKVFMSRLRDAFFIISNDDKLHLLEDLRRKGWLEDEISNLEKYNYSYIVRHCQRSIPSPDVLQSRINLVVEQFTNGKSSTGEELLRPGTWVAIQALMNHVIKGCISDIPGKPLYYYVKIGNKMVLRCGRGSHEGFHLYLRRCLNFYQASPKYALLCITEFIYRWNIRALSRSRDQPFFGHYNLILLEEIKKISSELGIIEFPNFVSVRTFQDTKETFGILNRDILERLDANTMAGETGEDAYTLEPIGDEVITEDDDENDLNEQVVEEQDVPDIVTNYIDDGDFKIGDMVKYKAPFDFGIPIENVGRVMSVQVVKRDGVFIGRKYAIKFLDESSLTVSEETLVATDSPAISAFNLNQIVSYKCSTIDAAVSAKILNIMEPAVYTVSSNMSARTFMYNIEVTDGPVVENVSENMLSNFVKLITPRKATKSQVELSALQGVPGTFPIVPPSWKEDMRPERAYYQTLQENPACMTGGTLNFDKMVKIWNESLVNMTARPCRYNHLGNRSNTATIVEEDI